MKKLLFILFFSFITQFSYGQSTFTQTFVDRCTGEVQIVTANFVQGSAVVAFYNEVKLFTYAQFLNGQLQQWLIQKYEWWQALSPCSQATQQTQQAQQTAQTAAQAASAATNTTSNATSNTTNGTTSNGASSGSNTEGSNSNTSGSSESSSGDGSSGNGEGESGGGEETSSETSESESESNETESESEESSEEGSEKDGDDKEEGEGGDDDEDSDDGKKSKKKKKQKMMPIQLKADMMGQQSLLGTYNSVINFGASQSSIFGDVNYGANLMVWDNLKQVGLSLNRSKVILNDNYQAKWVDATSISYMRNYRMNAVSISLSRLKPMGVWGTIGVGVNYSNLFGKDNFNETMPSMYSLGWNVLYTNSFQITPRINYAPAIIGAQNPLTIVNPIEEDFTTISKDFIGILSNSFTIRSAISFFVNPNFSIFSLYISPR